MRERRLCLVLWVLSLGCDARGLERGEAAAARNAPDDASVDWTLLIFAAHDDHNADLVRSFDVDAQEEWARMIGGSKRFRVVVQRDYAESNPGNPATERYVLERGQKRDPRTLEPGSRTHLGPGETDETDTTRPEALRDFLADAIERFPARRYWIVFSGHGDNWLGLATDASAGAGNRLPLASLRAELQAAAEGPLKRVRAAQRAAGVEGLSDRFDVVQFDACRMGSLEVATAMRGVADYMVASQENEPGAGHPYGALYGIAQNHLRTEPRRAVRELVIDYARAYNEHLSTRSRDYVGSGVTAVALDLARLDGADDDPGALLPALRTLVQAVRADRQEAGLPAGLACPEVTELRRRLEQQGEINESASDPNAARAPGESPAKTAAADLGALLELLAADDAESDCPAGTFDTMGLGCRTRRAARELVRILDRPDDRYDHVNGRFGLRVTGEDAFQDSVYVAEAHSLHRTGAGFPTGLSVLFGDVGPLLKSALGSSGAPGRPGLTTYGELDFQARTGWLDLFSECVKFRRDCAAGVYTFQTPNPCL